MSTHNICFNVFQLSTNTHLISSSGNYWLFETMMLLVIIKNKQLIENEDPL